MTKRIDKPDTEADRTLKVYLSNPNRGSFVMVAGAGSGKTTSLVKALSHIEQIFGQALKQNGQKIACITYTEIAVSEILSDVGSNSIFHVSTIHSFLWDLVKPFQSDISVWVQQRMKEKLSELQLEKATFGSRVQQKTRERNARAIERIELQIPKMETVKRFTYGTGSKYIEGILGHDDIIKMVPELIKTKPLLCSIISQRYPFFFVDESQDTVPEVVEALQAVSLKNLGRFCLGFFGDPMQKVYATGIGEISILPGWEKITKPENFRCPTKVLSVINNIRAKSDGLVQTRGRHQMSGDLESPVIGTARMFILPTDDQRLANLNRVRRWLSKVDGDPTWTSDDQESGVRILVIEHRMAAARLGFSDLYSAFKDEAPNSLAENFRDGTAWPLRPFLDALLPLASAFSQGKSFDVMNILRKFSPRLEHLSLKDANKISGTLSELKADIGNLAKLLSAESDATVQDVLSFAYSSKLIMVDERFQDYISPTLSSEKEKPDPILTEENANVDGEQDASDQHMEALAIAKFLECPAVQLWGYQKYQLDLSRYATHQGVKGAEFRRVIVVLDDDEGRHFQFSYEKLLGLKDPSKRDLENIKEGKDSVFERTRRLLYVCCSRATQDLVVVLYSENVDAAYAHVKTDSIFEPSEIYSINNIP